MKAPFVTNSQHFKRYVTSEGAARRHMNMVTTDLRGGSPSCYIIPYMMMQEKVQCNDEVKMVYLNKVFSHFVSSRSLKRVLPGHDSDAIVAFGNSVIALLGQQPHFILDGLSRIDVFYSQKHDKLVVNEVESLEAIYYCSDKSKEDRVIQFLESYWENKIYECFVNVCELCV